jgi:uncharacterized repeat protein (TIGR04052 family)
MPTKSPVSATLLAVALLLGGCSSEGDSGGPSVVVPPGYVQRTIGFEARVGSEPFDCSGVYQLGTPPSEARPNQLRLFVSDLALIDANRVAVPVVLDEDAWQGNFPAEGHTVALLDFDDGSGNCRFSDVDRHTAITGWVPGDRELVGLSFTIGVPRALNHQDAGLAPPPLNRPGLWFSERDGYVSLRLELDTVNANSQREATVDDRTAPGGWQLWLAESAVASPYARGIDPAQTPSASCGDVPCPIAEPLIVLDAFDVASDTVVLDVGRLLEDVDFTRTEFDPRPRPGDESRESRTITDYPMPDYAPGFFMEPVDGEGAVVLPKLGIDWYAFSQVADPSRQVFARRGE